MQIADAPDDATLRMILGVDCPKLITAVVEDRCARIITQEALRIFRPDVSSLVHVSDAGSNDDILAVLTSYPRTKGSPTLIGILDGDQKKYYDLTKREDIYIPPKMRHPLEFVPTDLAPELLLRNHCKAAYDEMTAALKIPKDRVVAALSSVDGLDHHDWLEELSKRFEIPFDQLVRTLMAVTFGNPAIRKEFEEFADRVAYYVNKFQDS